MSRIEKQQAEMLVKENRFLTDKAHLVEARPWYKRIVNAEGGLSHEMVLLGIKVNSLKKEIVEHKDRLRILEGRVGPGRCLKCGSAITQLIPSKFDHYPDDSSSMQSFEIGFSHPGCGGLIIGTPSQARFSVVLQHRVYNTEGYFMHIVEDEL
jgi:hypothetical protein